MIYNNKRQISEPLNLSPAISSILIIKLMNRKQVLMLSEQLWASFNFQIIRPVHLGVLHMPNHNFATNKMYYKVLNDIHLNIYLFAVRTHPKITQRFNIILLYFMICRW